MDSIQGLTRNNLDKFYTKPELSSECITHILNHIIIKDSDIIIEPSAGNGSFLDILKRKFRNQIYAYDISPQHSDVIHQDFLKLDLTHFKNHTVHFVGNPPFGRQSSLARKFIKKCAETASSISFILPKSFKKESFTKVFPQNFHNIFSVDMQPKSFYNDSIGDLDVPCVFQIWIKKNTLRPIHEKVYENQYYSFVKKHDSPDFSLRRVGGKAGALSYDINKNEQSHYFIKIREPCNQDLFFEKYRSIVFTHNNTVGPRSISKQEFIRQINKQF